MNRYSGVVHNAGRTDGTKVYLPLEEVRVHTLILDGELERPRVPLWSLTWAMDQFPRRSQLTKCIRT